MVKASRLLRLVALCLLLAASLPVPALSYDPAVAGSGLRGGGAAASGTYTAVTVPDQNAATVDPRVLQDTAGSATGHFIVVLRAQADARAAAASALAAAARTAGGRGGAAQLHGPAWVAQGAAVLSALQTTAAASQPAVKAQLDALGAHYQAFYILNALAVTGGRAVVEALAARPDVASIVPDRTFKAALEQPAAPGTSGRTRRSGPAQAGIGIPWNIAQTHAPDLWAMGITGRGIVYANADTGVMWDHPALKNQYRGWNGTTADHNYNWWDAIITDTITGSTSNPCGYALQAPCDDYGHGTHTMGIGVGNDAEGDQIGMAPGARWIACRNMDDGTGRPSTYIDCFQFFLAPWDLKGNNPNPSLRPDVVGNSYGCPTAAPPEGEGCDAHVMQQALESLNAAGIFMSVSAGNDGASGCGTIDQPPGLEASVFTVGATDINASLASFSSLGPVTIDGSNLRKPDLAAPGVDVISSYYDGSYVYMSGTSMSAPHVAGAVALLWSAFPMTLTHDVDLTESILESSAGVTVTVTPPPYEPSSCGGIGLGTVPNDFFGYGLLDVLAAYRTPVHVIWLPLVQQAQP
jgi:subtilisin family serine protease